MRNSPLCTKCFKSGRGGGSGSLLFVYDLAMKRKHILLQSVLKVMPPARYKGRETRVRAERHFPSIGEAAHTCRDTGSSANVRRLQNLIQR